VAEGVVCAGLQLSDDGAPSPKVNPAQQVLASNSTYYIDYSSQKGDDGNIAITERLVYEK
jgi:hypothetical protein